MLIDVHAHFCPAEYRDALESFGRPLPRRLSYLLTNPPNLCDARRRLALMDEASITMQVLAVPAPNLLSSHEPEQAKRLMTAANNGLADTVSRYPSRFLALGTVSLEFPELAAEELWRVINELSFPGIMIGANINEKELDSPEFDLFWQTADRLNAAVFIHPATRPSWVAFQDYALEPDFGYLVDTSLAACRIFYAGILDRYPNMRIILPHLGGVLPFIIGRLNRGHNIREAPRRKALYPPGEYLRRCYVDTASFHPPALLATLEVMSSSRMLLGSDAPHPIGGMKEAVMAVRQLGLTPQDTDAILGKNAVSLLGLAL